MAVYTGVETRYKMNSNEPKQKVGKLDLELNLLSKILFVIMLLMSLAIVAMSGF